MTPDPIPLRAASMLECRNCGAGAPVDEHFCPQCNRILALGRYGDFFTFFGLPRRLGVDPRDLERRFRDLSRQFHPDYFYNAPPAERLARLCALACAAGSFEVGLALEDCFTLT